MKRFFGWCARKEALQVVPTVAVGAFIVLLILSSIGCTDAGLSRLQAIGREHQVELYSGGSLVKTWTSTGKVLCEQDSDGYYFCDKATENLVRVSGDLVITPK